MRKVFGFILAGIVLLAGCAPPPPPAPPAPAVPVVALVVKTLINPFFIEMEKGARRAAAEFGFTLKVKSAAQETSIDQQIAIIETLIDERVSAIVIAPGSSKDLVPVLKKAQDRGIRLVNVDNQIDPDEAARAGLQPVPFISVDNVQGGYLAARYLVQSVKSPAQAIILEGIREAANANQRKAGAEKGFAENRAVTVVASETAHWKIDEAHDVTKALMTKHPGVSLIFAANDMMALGAVEYLKEAGLSAKVVGYDALDQAKTAVREGRMAATVDQQADQQGYIGCVTAFQLLQGQTVAPQVIVEVRLVTQESLAAAP